MARLRALLRSFIALACASVATAASAQSFTGLFVFGDSLSDRGNVALAVGADPAQTITGNSYIPSKPYASNQFSNGDVWVKTFAEALGLAPFATPSLAGGGDFAFGGARVATDGVGLPPSLSEQETQFLSATGGSAPPGALYIVAGGGNDARDALAAAASSGNPLATIASFAAEYAQATGLLVDRLQTAGARHIVVWDVPNVGLAPAVTTLGGGASGLAMLVSQAMNTALAARLALESGATVFDVYSLQNAIVANPASFRLTNVTDACGAIGSVCNPATSLFWDGIHPTSAGHAILAQGMLAVVAVPEPEEYALLVAGSLLVAWRTSAKRRGRG
jgi:outer membrane lipase/esterase